MLLPAINTFAPASAAFTNVSAFTPPSSDRYFKMGYLFAIDLSLMSTSHWNLTLAAPGAASGCNNDIMLSDTTCTSCISWGHDLCMAATLWDAIGQAVSTRGPYTQLLHLSAHGKKLPVWASCTKLVYRKESWSTTETTTHRSQGALEQHHHWGLSRRSYSYSWRGGGRPTEHQLWIEQVWVMTGHYLCCSVLPRQNASPEQMPLDKAPRFTTGLAPTTTITSVIATAARCKCENSSHIHQSFHHSML